MKINSKGIALIKRFEGCKLTAYWDVNGYSIGYGHHTGVNKGDKITQAQADKFLEEDLNKYEKAVIVYLDRYNFNENQFSALVSFAYNCGTGNLSQLLAHGTRTIGQIESCWLKYVNAGGLFNKGLYTRRCAELNLFREKVETSKDNFYYPKYTGDSPRIDEVMEAIQATVDYDYLADKPWKKRIPIATANGIKKYTGTATQNTKLIKLASEGKLKRVKL